MRTRPQALLICAECRKEFERDAFLERKRVTVGRSGPFCGLACARKSQRNRLTHTCSQCEVTFESRASRVAKTEGRGGVAFCSRACYAQSREEDPVARFMRLWEYSDGCWRWKGARQESGHGAFRAAGRTTSAHRFAWECYHERPVGSGHELHHRCHNPWCVHPLHLEEVTRTEHLKRHGPRGWELYHQRRLSR